MDSPERPFRARGSGWPLQRRSTGRKCPALPCTRLRQARLRMNTTPITRLALAGNKRSSVELGVLCRNGCRSMQGLARYDRRTGHPYARAEPSGAHRNFGLLFSMTPLRLACSRLELPAAPPPPG
jgi:hypothetical protein